ncbi:MAG: AbrB/MazE/SpoVT family DNA-binding domain-containing protein [Deltaproteobacteria bacterium]|nr:AbrB/MazE/SpoVT family DNA-binding domain-containing protein [Deltaproteobacteria bacterium]
MSKVTSKLQVTVPKALADRYGIRPGDDIEWQPAGDVIRVVPGRAASEKRPIRERLACFDQATARQARRDQTRRTARPPRGRGWTRDELYQRGRAR